MKRITTLPWPLGLPVTDAETGAPGEVIDICDGYRVRVQWDLNGRITRVPVERLRERTPPRAEAAEAAVWEDHMDPDDPEYDDGTDSVIGDTSG